MKISQLLIVGICLTLSSCLKDDQNELYDTSGTFHTISTEHNLVYGEHGEVLGHRSWLKKRKVKEISLLECNGIECQGYWYSINSKGEKAQSSPSYNSSTVTYSYDNKHRLKKEKISWEGNQVDLIHTYKYYGDSTSMDIYSPLEDELYNLSVSNPNCVFDIIQNSSGRVVSQVLYDLNFACGEEFEGENQVEFEYLDNGLINNIKIENISSKEVKTFYFSYTF